MTDRIEIRGGAHQGEAAAVVAVINHVLEVEQAARSRRPTSNTTPPAWMRAGWPRRPDDPLDLVYPDHRGDPI